MFQNLVDNISYRSQLLRYFICSLRPNRDSFVVKITTFQSVVKSPNHLVRFNALKKHALDVIVEVCMCYIVVQTSARHQEDALLPRSKQLGYLAFLRNFQNTNSTQCNDTRKSKMLNQNRLIKIHPHI